MAAVACAARFGGARAGPRPDITLADARGEGASESGSTKAADAVPKVAESVKSSSEVLVASVFTTAIRYCEPVCTVSAAAKLDEVRNAADSPAADRVTLATTVWVVPTRAAALRPTV